MNEPEDSFPEYGGQHIIGHPVSIVCSANLDEADMENAPVCGGVSFTGPGFSANTVIVWTPSE